MNLEVLKEAFDDELGKIAAELNEASRDKIAPKNFALSPKQSGTGKPAYPIEDKHHAANALARVKQNGSPAEKSEVYKDVAKKYPGLAAKSSVGAVKAKVKSSQFAAPGAMPATMGTGALPTTPAPAPQVAGSVGPGGVAKIGGVLSALAHNEPLQHKMELAGLGVLAAPGLDTIQSNVRARMAHDTSPDAAKKRQLMSGTGHAIADVGGLGVLMAPEIAHLRGH
jgi:hypothetical protein